METVIRLKGERRLLFQDAESMFRRDEGRKKSFAGGKKRIEVWDLSGSEIENSPYKLRIVRYHAKHCYCHTAVEVIFNLMIIGFNMRELYLYRRIRRFKGSGISRKSVSRKFCDELLIEKVQDILYEKGG